MEQKTLDVEGESGRGRLPSPFERGCGAAAFAPLQQRCSSQSL